MPPSPALRFSPSRELNHKRGRSLEGGLHLKVKDDDLALFTDMENRERETFLLHSSADIDESLSTKLKHFSDFKFGIAIPVRGESSLLNEEGDKNDYDWLLTPPDTPLFPSLDDEDEKQPVNLIHRGRPRSQPIQISRTSMTESSYRSGRSSASPHRLSPSPRSSNNSYLSRGRPSSTSPGPVLRSHSPSQRPSTPNKPSTMTPRSSTPTLRRMSTGSNATPSSSKSGTSPGKATRGNSASPKLRAWQSNLPGFSSDPPPNLRTSSDWPTPHVRGVSPASRNGRDTSFSKIRRQSMSPTASRSASSFHNHDRDRFSSHSKGSIASSGDDDMDSLQSAPVVLSQQSTARKNGSFPSTRSISLSKKPSRTLSVGSAPKRSFDYAPRQMDNRKGPQNMFRPLLSSVPSTTFYAGKANPTHYPIISRNSSITTSSNASSEQGVSVALDTEGSEHDQDDLNSDWVKTPYSDTQEEEIFVLDRADEVKESIMDEDGKPADQHGDFGENTSSQAEARVCKAISSDQPAVVNAETRSHFGCDSSEVVSGSIIARCSICYSEFQTADHINDDNSFICPNCSAKSGLRASPFSVEINQDDVTRGMNLEENNSVEMDGDSILAELPGETGILAMSIKNEASITQDIVVHSLDNLKEGDLCLLDPERVGSKEFNTNEKDCTELNQQLHYFDGLSSSKADNAECLGISVLLKKSNSTKWPVVQGRTFTATTISCDNLSYMRDNINSVRNYNVEGSASASSSVDLSSHAQRQFGGKKVDMEIRREDINRMLLSSRSSVSGISDNSYGAIFYSEGISEGRIEDSAKNLEIEGVEDSRFVPKGSQVLEGKEFDHQRVVVSSASDLATPARESQLNDFLVAGFVNNEDFDAGNALGIPDDRENILEIADSYVCMEKYKIEEADTTNCGGPCLVDMGDSLRDNVVMISGEFKDESGEDHLPSDGATSQHPENMVWVPDEPPASTTIEKGEPIAASETDNIGQDHNCSEEAIVKIKGVRGHKARSLTLEEATDTILFCSSIVHNIAYEAATIAIEKERPTTPVDVYRATPASFVARSSMKDSTRRSKAAKTRHKWTDSAVKPPVQKIENDVENQETFAKDVPVSHKPDSMKPPKLESKCNCTIM